MSNFGQFRKCVSDGPTDGPTEGRTDKPSYRESRTHLKTSTKGYIMLLCFRRFFVTCKKLCWRQDKTRQDETSQPLRTSSLRPIPYSVKHRLFSTLHAFYNAVYRTSCTASFLSIIMIGSSFLFSWFSYRIVFML